MNEPVYLVFDKQHKQFCAEVFSKMKLDRNWASEEWGFPSYEEAYEADWCEVVKYVPGK